MTDSTLNTLGLALRARHLAVGEEPVAEVCRTHRARLVVLAGDGADNTARKARRLARESGAPAVTLPCTKAELGFALGRASCAVAAVTDAGFAASLLRKLAAAGVTPDETGAHGQDMEEMKNGTEHRRWPV